jgi:hypothetical protein
MRWNSTYMMLKHLLPYRETFSTFIGATYGLVMIRTWHLRIRSLFIWWDHFDICIVTPGTTHFIPHVHVFIWLKVCFKVQAHQSPTFGSDVVIMSLIFTLGTPIQVGACLKDMENTLRMVQDVLHLGHHLRRTARASKPSWRPNQVGFDSVSKFRNSMH